MNAKFCSSDLKYPKNWINFDLSQIFCKHLHLFDVNIIHILFYVSKLLNSEIKKNSNKFWDKFAFKSEINSITNHSGMIFDGPDGEDIEIQKQNIVDGKCRFTKGIELSKFSCLMQLD